MAKPTKKKPPSIEQGGGKPFGKGQHRARAKPAKKPRGDPGFDVAFDPSRQLVARARLASGEAAPPGPDVLDRLWALVERRRSADPELSHAARLLKRGAPRIARKLGEEAVECLIEVMAGSRAGLVAESADLLYHLVVTWVYADIRPEEVWQELLSRESVSYSTEGAHGALKRLLGSVNIGTTKIP